MDLPPSRKRQGGILIAQVDSMADLRILSLVPAGTEIIATLGLSDYLVGRSHECDYPASITDRPSCTRSFIDSDRSSGAIHQQVRERLQQGLPLYQVDTEQIEVLKPTFIVTQSHCPICAVGEEMVANSGDDHQHAGADVVSLQARGLPGLWEDMLRIAETAGIPEQGKLKVKELKHRVVDVIEKVAAIAERPSVISLEWLDPIIGSGNWIPELIELAGGDDLIGVGEQEVSEVSWEAICRLDPAKLFLLPCGLNLTEARRGLPALQQRPEWGQLRAVKEGEAYLLDGQSYFNRPGPRLVDSLEIAAEILHPETFDYGFRGQAWETV